MNTTPRPFGVYVNRVSEGEKYWFLSISVPKSWMELEPGCKPGEVGELLTALFRLRDSLRDRQER